MQAEDVGGFAPAPPGFIALGPISGVVTLIFSITGILGIPQTFKRSSNIPIPPPIEKAVLNTARFVADFALSIS